MTVMADETAVETFTVNLSDIPKSVEATANFDPPPNRSRATCDCSTAPRRRTPWFHIHITQGRLIGGTIRAHLDYAGGDPSPDPMLVFGWKNLSINNVTYQGYARARFDDNGAVEVTDFHVCRLNWFEAPTPLGERRGRELLTLLAERFLPSYEVNQMWRTHIAGMLRAEVDQAQGALAAAEARLASFYQR